MSSERSSRPVRPFGAPAARRAKRAKAPLTIERIVDTAFDLMGREGFEAVTMRRLASELGTGAASLYAHVAGKSELNALIVDRMAEEITIPDPDPEHWQEQIMQVGRDLRAAMARHPGVARAVIGYIPTGPEAMLTSERLLAILLAGGVVEQVAAWACDLLPLYVTAVAFEESVEQLRTTTDPVEVEAFISQLRAYFESLPVETFPHVVASAVALTSGDGDRRFEFGLQVILAGLAAVSASWTDDTAGP